MLWGKIDHILKEHYVSNLKRVAAQKFIKDRVGNPNDHEVHRLREWIMMRVNEQRLPKTYHKR